MTTALAPRATMVAEVGILNEIMAYGAWLAEQGRATATREKYERDAAAFLAWLGGRKMTRAAVAAYRAELAENHSTAAANVALAAVNGYLAFCGKRAWKMPTIYSFYSLPHIATALTSHIASKKRYIPQKTQPARAKTILRSSKVLFSYFFPDFLNLLLTNSEK